MAWFCSGYFPRRFILGVIRGLTIKTRLARVWLPRESGSWHWITSLNTWGSAPSLSEAMDAAEASLEHRLGERK